MIEEETFPDDFIPKTVQAEVWAWVLGIITGASRFELILLWMVHKSGLEMDDSALNYFEWNQYLKKVGVNYNPLNSSRR